YAWLKRCASWFASCMTLRARAVNRSYINNSLMIGDRTAATGEGQRPAKQKLGQGIQGFLGRRTAHCRGVSRLTVLFLITPLSTIRRFFPSFRFQRDFPPRAQVLLRLSPAREERFGCVPRRG